MFKIEVHQKKVGVVGRIVSLEHVILTLTLKHPRRGKVEINLTSPSGTNSVLLTRRPNDNSTKGLDNWSMMSVHFWGENPNGTWLLQIADSSKSSLETRRLTQCTLNVFGTHIKIREPTKNIPWKGNPRTLQIADVKQIVEREQKHSECVGIRKRSSTRKNANAYSKFQEVMHNFSDGDSVLGNLNEFLSMYGRLSKVGTTHQEDGGHRKPGIKKELRSVLHKLYHLYNVKISEDSAKQENTLGDVFFKKVNGRYQTRKLYRILAVLNDLDSIS